MTGLFRLLRFPALMAAVMAAAALLALTTAAAPLFIASAGGDLFERFSSSDRLRPPSVTITSESYTSLGVARYRDRLLRSALEPLTGTGITTSTGEALEIRLDDESDPGRLVSRSRALENVELLEGSGDEGVWLADYTAERIGATVGDEVRLVPALGRASGSVEITGIYRDIMKSPVTAYWTPVQELIYPGPGEDTRPPVPVLVEEGTFFALNSAMEDDVTEFQWEFPVPNAERTLDQADGFADALYSINLQLSDPTSQLGAAFPSSTFDTPTAGWVQQTRDVLSTVSGPVGSLSIAGRAVALAALAGAGLFGVRRRRIEFGIFIARGVTPWRLGLRSAIEMLLPAAIGGAVGWYAATWMVHALGPQGVLARPALQESAALAGGTIAVGLAAVAVAVAVSAKASAAESTGRVAGLAKRFAWEPLVLVLAGASFYEIVSRPQAAISSGDNGNIELDALHLVFPLLFIAGGAGVAIRVLFRILPRVRTKGASLKPALYLAFRRLTHGSGSARVFVTAAAIAIGIFVFASVMSSSTEATASQDASLAVGSDVRVSVGRPPDLADAPFKHTTVVRLSSATVDDGGSGRVELLGVDTSTFENVAFWRDEFASEDLAGLMSRLRPEPGQESIPVLASGDDLSGDTIFGASLGLPMEVVARARALPGMFGTNGVLIADLEALSRAFESEGRSLVSLAGGYELWAKGASEDEVVAALEAEGASVRESLSAEELQATPGYLALTWTFDFLEALGVITSIVVLVGALLFLQARQRRAEASYAIARRMGLRPSSHRWSVALELIGMLLVSALVGAALAIGAAAFIHARMDVGGGDQVPLFLVPPLPLLTLCTVLAAFAIVCAIAVQRRADSADVSQVMRYGS